MMEKILKKTHFDPQNSLSQTSLAGFVLEKDPRISFRREHQVLQKNDDGDSPEQHLPEIFEPSEFFTQNVFFLRAIGIDDKLLMKNGKADKKR